MGGVFTGLTTAANAGVDEDKAGLAAGLLNTGQQLGAALGLAVLSALATARTNSLLHGGTTASPRPQPTDTSAHYSSARASCSRPARRAPGAQRRDAGPRRPRKSRRSTSPPDPKGTTMSSTTHHAPAEEAGGTLAGRLLLWGVVIPGLVFLLSNPFGWFLLFLGVLAAFGLSAALGA